MRLDRILTLGFFGPVARFLNNGTESRVPILMYHSISDPREAVGKGYYQMNTSPEIFRQHMEYLAKRGIKAVGLQEGMDSAFTRSVRGKIVILTFDDAFQDFFDNAFPVLKEMGYSATVFVPTGMVGKSERKFQNRKCMSWEQIATLAANGIEFGSHSVSHRELFSLTTDEVVHEIVQSKRDLEKMLKKEVVSFSYPYAFPDWKKNFVDKCKTILKGNGYLWAVTTRVGRISAEDGNYTLRRIPVSGADDLHFFDAKIRGGYDWFRVPQLLFKRIKHFL